MFRNGVEHKKSIVFEIPSPDSTIFEDIQKCDDFLREQGVNDTAQFCVMLCDLFRGSTYAAKRKGIKSSITLKIDLLIDNAVQVTVIDNVRGYQCAEIRRIRNGT